MSILDRFVAFLNMSDESLKRCVDLYNRDRLSQRSRIALEAIEAIGDSSEN